MEWHEQRGSADVQGDGCQSNANTNTTAKSTVSQTPPSSSSDPVASAFNAPPECGRYDGFTWFLDSEGLDCKKKNPGLAYDPVRRAMYARWCGMNAKEWGEFEKVATTLKSAEGREMFNRPRASYGLPPWEDPNSREPTASSSAAARTITAATAASATSSKAPVGITWKDWAEMYDGFAWFLSSQGYEFKQQHRDIDYDVVVKVMESRWKSMTEFRREEYESNAKMLRMSYGGRQMFSKLRRLCGLPEMPDVVQPAKTVAKPRTPIPSTWRGSGSKVASSLLSSSPRRPDPPASSSADRSALTEIQPNRMAAATLGLSDKVSKIDITSAWAVKSSKLKIH